ncbi:MAG: hypothetical protein J5706_06480, partial [Elusimicrobiales bacterium]|nr:hypothetical protein [Elusimicrobiales bacterium]
MPTLNKEKSKLLSLDNNFTFCIDNLSDNCIGMLCYVKESDEPPVMCKRNKSSNVFEFSLNVQEGGKGNDVELIPVYKINNDEIIRDSIPAHIHWGKCRYRLKKIPWSKKYTLSLEDDKIELPKDTEWAYDKITSKQKAIYLPIDQIEFNDKNDDYWFMLRFADDNYNQLFD